MTTGIPTLLSIELSPMLAAQASPPHGPPLLAQSGDGNPLMWFGVIGAAALLLSAVGVHGLVAHSVAERRREIGVRLALGATAGQTIRSMASSGVGLAAIGAVAGLVLAWPVAQALDNRGLLWGVDSHDPATFVAGVAFLLAVAAIASIVPALKILRLDPAQALRE